MASERGSRKLGPLRKAWLIGLLTAGTHVWAQELPSPEPIPPPPDATDAQVIEHLLAPELGYWSRVGEPAQGAGHAPADGDFGLTQDAARFAPAAWGRAFYLAPGGTLQARALVLIMASQLDCLGVFAARRPATVPALTLRSPAFWREHAMEAYAGRIYLQVALTQPHEAEVALARDLMAQLELRLPPPPSAPRLLRVLPRRWIGPFRTGYGPALFCDLTLDVPAVSATYELGSTPLSLSVAQVQDEGAAHHLYGTLLAHALTRGQAYELRDVAEEAFACVSSEFGVCAALRQDEFVAWLMSRGTIADAEAVLRLVALRVRVTRPLVGTEETD